MKKGFKRFLSVGMALTLVAASFTGCGSKDKGAGDTFLIGGIGPISGAAASYGMSVKQGAQIAVNEINDKGGVSVAGKKMKLKLNFMDDQATAENAATAYNALMDAGAKAIMGTVTSSACLGIVDLTHKDNILQLTPSGSAAGITKYPNIFRLCFTDPLQGVTMADFMVKTKALTKVAVIYNNSDDYSTGMMKAFVEQVKKDGGEVVDSESFTKGDVDFNTQLTKIKGTDAQAIFVPAYYQDAAYITTQASALGMKLPFFGGDGWDGVIDKSTDKASLEGATFLSPFLASDPNAKVQDFVKKYKASYKATPDQFAADGYDSIYVIAAAMEKAGKTDSKDLIAAMTQIKVEGITGSMNFNKNGEPNKGAKFVTISNGEYKALAQ